MGGSDEQKREGRGQEERVLRGALRNLLLGLRISARFLSFLSFLSFPSLSSATSQFFLLFRLTNGLFFLSGFLSIRWRIMDEDSEARIEWTLLR